MGSRMSKYFEEQEVSHVHSSRLQRNEDLYKAINKNELNSYDIKSNATILGDNNNEIDIEKIKKILDTKYNETPKRKSIRLENTEEVKEEKEITKEYDINVILEKAREEKNDNYEEERLKKIRDTQFNILKNLNIEKNDKEEFDDEINDSDLKTLINTIAYNEKNQEKDDSQSALDILSELKGSDNTETLSGLKEEIDIKEKENITDTKMINSFYTSSNALKNKDFEDIDDFTKELENNNYFIKVVIAIIIIVFVIGVVLIINTFLA